MRRLLWGLVDFRERKLSQYAERFRELALAQEPDALLVTCSDSRVVPDLLASTHPGDLFTMRNVGNLIPPASPEGHSTGDVSEASAIEYSVLVLNVPHLVVCGHSECGAMKAVLEGHVPPAAPNLRKWLLHAHSAVLRLNEEGALNPALEPYDQLSQWNVLTQLEHLMSYPAVSSRVAEGRLRLSGLWFDIASGGMYAYQRESHSFEIIDRRLAERLVAGDPPQGE